MLKECLLVMLGGGLGAVFRYIISNLLSKRFDRAHWATFWVNTSGCFLMGLLLEILLGHTNYLYTFIIIGIIGSYTTFSTFEYENIDLIAHEQYAEFLKYSTYSCIFGILGIFLGLYVGEIIKFVF